MADLPSTCKLERFFDKYTRTTKYMLCGSDAESLQMKDLLDMADDECKELWDNLKLSYTECKGNSLLRKEIAPLHGVTPDDVMVVIPQEGIYIAMKCLVTYLTRLNGNEPIHAIAMYPAYQSLYSNLQHLGCDLDYWRVKEGTSKWELNVDELKSLLKKNTKLLVVNFPHNPTGYVASKKLWQEIIDICKERNIFLFSDEMYRLSDNDGSESLASASAIYENSISLFGMSKTFALAGLRLGWMASRNKEIVDMMMKMKDYISICPPGPTEILSIIGLRNKDKLIEHTLKIVKPNLMLFRNFFDQHKDIFTWFEPTACTTGYLKVKGWLLNLGDGGASGFCDKLAKDKEVLLLPATIYDDEDIYCRVGFGRMYIDKCLDLLGEFINENKPK